MYMLNYANANSKLVIIFVLHSFMYHGYENIHFRHSTYFADSLTESVGVETNVQYELRLAYFLTCFLYVGRSWAYVLPACVFHTFQQFDQFGMNIMLLVATLTLYILIPYSL
jgi:hypothetical protein